MWGKDPEGNADTATQLEPRYRECRHCPRKLTVFQREKMLQLNEAINASLILF